MAAKPYPYTKISWSGIIQGVQTWSTGCDVSHSLDTDEKMEDFLIATAGLLVTWWEESIKQINFTSTTLVTCRGYFYEAGATSATLQGEAPLVGTHVGFSGTSGYARNAMVVSKRSTHPGASGRGRMYVPATGAFTDLLQYQAVDTNRVNLGTATLLNGMNAIPVTDSVGTCVIAGQSSVRKIVRLTTDTLPDTQRRREDKIGALHESTNLVS